MTAAVSLLIVAVGAILHFAVSDSLDGVELRTVGVILMLVGGLGLAIAALQFFSDRHRTVEREVIDTPAGERERIAQR